MPPTLGAAALSAGEFAALDVIAVTAIPHASILFKRFQDTPNVDVEHRQDMARLLGEVFQAYSQARRSGGRQEVSLEVLWTTRPVEQQPHRADIRLHLVTRAVDATPEAAAALAAAVRRSVIATLDFGKYQHRDATVGELLAELARERDKAVALVKEERVDDLQNQLVPEVFAFARLPQTNNDLSRVAGVLIDHPDCAVSFQVMATAYRPDELQALGQVTQALETLTKGVADHGLGTVAFGLAERHAQRYRHYSDHRDSALFEFNITVAGPAESVQAIAARLFSQFDVTTELKVVAADDWRGLAAAQPYPLPWAWQQVVVGRDRSPAIWAAGRTAPSFFRLPYVVTAQEAAEFFRLPIANDNLSAGFQVTESARTSRSYAEGVVGASDIEVGRLAGGGAPIGFSLRDLTKHMLIVGTPGSGKTTFSVGLLDRLWREHGIPFLVIEPAKNEYRALVQSIPELQVFTPGKSFISPFVFNPFTPPKNVRLETYKSTLKTAFAAGVSMSTPLDKIFEEAINNCYSDFRWLDTYTSSGPGRTFNIADFVRCFQETFDAIGYTGDARNIGRAGVVRLASLTNLFDTYSTIPVEDLLTRPTVIELAAVENSDQKSLLIALLLLQILAYVNANHVGQGGLRHVVLLEEAHVLLAAEAVAGEGEANPSAIAQDLVKRMLAEIRSYGVGVVIADQSPRKVTSDVVALTDIKLAFRLVEAADRQIVADASNMLPVQQERLGKLRPGQAFLFYGLLDEPEEVVTPDYRAQRGIAITLTDEDIRRRSTYWDGRAAALRPYPQCALSPHCQADCDLDTRVLGREIARRIFARHIGQNASDMEKLKGALARISALVREELNDEPFTRRLLTCVKAHLWRKVRYNTALPVSDRQIEASLARR
jgi:hypothetical protein